MNAANAADLRGAWIGIDCGYSQLSVSVLDGAGNTTAHGRAQVPLGDGHAHGIALARLQTILNTLSPLTTPRTPSILAGYCYDHSGVRAAFENAGWPVVGAMPLNDVVGVYGLTEMPGHVMLAGCGSFPQVVYIDAHNNVCWPSDAVAAALPAWPLSGDAYGRFMARAYREAKGRRLLSDTLGRPETRQYLQQAAHAIRETRAVLWNLSGQHDPPRIVVGGGAVSPTNVWAHVASALNAIGIAAERVVGDQAAGLARYALHHRDANAWAYLGDAPPSWLRS